jgi:hypothetical protein
LSQPQKTCVHGPWLAFRSERLLNSKGDETRVAGPASNRLVVTARHRVADVVVPVAGAAAGDGDVAAHQPVRMERPEMALRRINNAAAAKNKI